MQCIWELETGRLVYRAAGFRRVEFGRERYDALRKLSWDTAQPVHLYDKPLIEWTQHEYYRHRWYSWKHPDEVIDGEETEDDFGYLQTVEQFGYVVDFGTVLSEIHITSKATGKRITIEVPLIGLRHDVAITPGAKFAVIAEEVLHKKDVVRVIDVVAARVGGGGTRRSTDLGESEEARLSVVR